MPRVIFKNFRAENPRQLFLCMTLRSVVHERQTVVYFQSITHMKEHSARKGQNGLHAHKHTHNQFNLSSNFFVFLLCVCPLWLLKCNNFPRSPCSHRILYIYIYIECVNTDEKGRKYKKNLPSLLVWQSGLSLF